MSGAALDEMAAKGRDLGAFVVDVTFDRVGHQVAWALGDGTIHLASPATPRDWLRIEAHDGAALCLAADANPTGFVSGGDDGRFCRIAADGALEPLVHGGKWVEQAASFSDGRAGLLACAIGRDVHLFDAAGTRLKTLRHPSTVTGLAFDARGKRLAASHYNGASLWFTASKSDNPRLVEWKGSHIGVVLHPAGDALVTAMQDNALHGWRLTDGQHMRMTGYPGKTESMGFTRNGKYLASSGADAIVVWPFFGGGPMGKPPLELAQLEKIACTRVACHPRADLVAAGYIDGRVVLAEIGSGRALPLAGGGGPVSAMAWSPDGAWLAVGHETGTASLIDMSALGAAA